MGDVREESCKDAEVDAAREQEQSECHEEHQNVENDGEQLVRHRYSEGAVSDNEEVLQFVGVFLYEQVY